MINQPGLHKCTNVQTTNIYDDFMSPRVSPFLHLSISRFLLGLQNQPRKLLVLTGLRVLLNSPPP